MADVIDPLELLRPKEDRIKPWLHDKWAPIFGVTVGFIGVSFFNFATRRPWFSGIQKHIATAAGLGYGAYLIDQRRNDYLAEKDAVLRHYIELHPEDFVPEVRKKYGEIFEPWIPIR